MQQYTQSRQNKVKLISLLVFILLLVAAFFWYRSATTPGNAAEAASNSMFMGLNPVTAQQVQALWPDAKGRPLLVEFHSRYCYDCKKMAPVIQDVLSRHPGVIFKLYEIVEDKKAHPAVMNAFQPVTVPVLVFIRPDGKIHNVLYNYQTGETIAANLAQITPQKAKTKAP